MVFAAGAGGGNPQRTYAVDRDAAIRSIDAALKVDVPRYVIISYFGAGPDHGVPEDNSFFAYAESQGAGRRVSPQDHVAVDDRWSEHTHR